MTTTREQLRTWQGPAVLSFGFRPFFLGGAVWAVAAMALWLTVLTGLLSLPTAFDAVAWHAHELLFGYLGAVLAGFLLTAVPSWTGRRPIIGGTLAALFLLWVLGRVAILISGYLPTGVVAALDLSFGLVLLVRMTYEVAAGRNWRNLLVVGLLAVFVLANGLFHWDVAREGSPTDGAGLRLGLGAAILLIAFIGGRIVPAFTRNWLAKHGAVHLPVPPMQRFDALALAVLAVAVSTWVGAPNSLLASLTLGIAGLLHVARLARWRGSATLSEPLVWVLHAAYAFVPLGALAEALSILRPDLLGGAPALHLWMAGAIGLMTVAVMTRATLGHTGHALAASGGTLAIYLCVIASVAFRVAAGLAPGVADLLHAVSAATWIAAFAGFVGLYGPKLIAPRVGE
ncbi:MAG: NnrS family protein [Pseudomonadota bacterium]